MPKTSGFTEAELAAFEWSKKQKDLEESRKFKGEFKRKYKTRDRSERRQHRDSSDDSSPDFDRFRGRKREKRLRSTSISSSSSYRSQTDSYHERNDKYHSRRRARRSRSLSSSESSSDNERSHTDYMPKDPFNPLKLAHDRLLKNTNRSKRERKKFSEETHNKHKKPQEDDKWKHDLYESDSERVSYESEIRRKNIEQNVLKTSSKLKEISGYESDSEKPSKLITKKGWKSRAGGVYIPGDDDSDQDLYYDYTNRKKNRSRSYERPDPSYTLD